MIIREAIRRREVFDNLEKYMKIIKEVVQEIDPYAEAYLFGSVAENRHTYSSDIDVLIITDIDPKIMISALWRAGIEDPLEIHIHKREKLVLYEKSAKLIKL